jgi:DNA polymerase-3 subunit beta
MKFTVKTDDIKSAVNATKKTVGVGIFPILENLFIECVGDEVIIRSSNIEIFSEYKIPVSGESDGIVCIPAKTLAHWLSFIRSEEITFEKNGFNLIAKDGKNETKFSGQNHLDFVETIKTGRGVIFSIDGEVLKEALNITLFTCGKSPTRPVLSGVSFAFRKSELVIAATDSYRIAEIKIQGDFVDSDDKYVVPASSLSLLADSLSENVEICLEKSQATFQCGNYVLITKLISFEFPRYENAIPVHNHKKIKVSRDDILNSINRVAVFADDVNNSVILEVSDSSVSVKDRGSQRGCDKSSFPAVVEGAESFTCAVNSKFLIGGFKKMNDEITISFGEPTTAIMMTDGYDGYSYTVLPLKI